MDRSSHRLQASVVAAIGAGDVSGVVGLLTAAAERERRSIADSVHELWQTVEWTLPRERSSAWTAAALAFVGTATATEVAGNRFLAELDDERVVELVLARGERFVDGVVGGLTRWEYWAYWWLLRALVKAGAIERPSDARYVAGMVGSLHARTQRSRTLDAVYEALLADSDLLEDEVWQIFEVDAARQLWQTCLPILDSHGLSVGRGESSWIHALVRLSAEGRLERRRLLDGSLDALTRDFDPSGIGWYCRLHEALEPTPSERRERLSVYLALLGSPVPAVVKLGLGAIRKVEQDVEPDALARAAVGPLLLSQKSIAVDALKLLDHAAARARTLPLALVKTVAHALSHERVDVQERAVAVLERHWPKDGTADELRRELIGLLDAVSPLVRPRLEALAQIRAGGEVEPSPSLDVLEAEARGLPVDLREAGGIDAAVAAVSAGGWPAPRQPRMTPDLLATVGTPLAPLESVDETLELAAGLMEGRGTGDDVERLLDGVSRFCDQRPRSASGLWKRARTIVETSGHAGAAELVATVLASWLGAREQPIRGGSPPMEFLWARAREVARRAAIGETRPLLALPTHAGGWIDPRTLAARQASADPGARDYDAVQAQIRSFFPEDDSFRVHPIVQTPTEADLRGRAEEILAREWVYDPLARGLEPEQAVERILRFQSRDPVLVFGSDGSAQALGPLAKGLEQLTLRSDHANPWSPPPAWSAGDATGAHWLTTIVPWCPELAFASAAISIWRDLDEPTVGEHADVVLLRALEPDVPIGPAGWTAVAGALLARSPALRRVGADVVHGAVADGRFDPATAGSWIAAILASGRGVVTRIVQPLRDAARTSELHAAQVARLLEACVAACGETRRGLGVVLELQLELATQLASRVEHEGARHSLERIRLQASASSKLGRATARLLALDGEPRRGARACALEVLVAQAKRVSR